MIQLSINPGKQSTYLSTVVGLQSLTCHHLIDMVPVVQSPISTNPGLALNKICRVNQGLALIGLLTTGPCTLPIYPFLQVNMLVKE